MKGFGISDSLSLPIEAITNTFAIFGIRGSGKSNLGAVMAEGIIKAGQPVCIIDPTGAWHGLKSSADGKHPGLPVYVFGGEHADVPLEPTAGEVVANFVIEQRVPVVLDLRLMRKYEQIRFVMTFAETLFHKNRQPLMVFIDEAARFAPQIIKDRSPDAARCLGAIEDLATLGRNRGLGVTLMAQRPAPVSTTLRTQIENLICLRTVGKHDRKAIDEWVEAKGSQEERDEMMADLASLPDGVGYFWSPAWLRKFVKTHFYRRETFDSGRTPRIGEKPITPKAFAEIDTKKLSAEIRATIERAKADDPKELRKQLAERDRLIATMGSAAPTKADPDAIKKAREAGAMDAKRHLAKSLRDFLKKLKERLERSRLFVGRAAEQAGFAVDQLSDFNIELPPSLDAIEPTMEAPARSATIVVREGAHQSKGEGFRKVSTPASKDSRKGRDPEVGKSGLSRMMTALAQWPGGTADSKLGVRSKVSVKGGSFDTYLSRGRKKGWIEGDRSCLSLTQAGLDALGEYDPLPTGKEAQRHWVALFGSSGASRMLQALCDSYPSTLTAEELGEQSGISVDGGSFDTYLSRLRSYDLISGDRKALSIVQELAE